MASILPGWWSVASARSSSASHFPRFAWRLAAAQQLWALHLGPRCRRRRLASPGRRPVVVAVPQSAACVRDVGAARRRDPPRGPVATDGAFVDTGHPGHLHPRPPRHVRPVLPRHRSILRRRSAVTVVETSPNPGPATARLRGAPRTSRPPSRPPIPQTPHAAKSPRRASPAGHPFRGPDQEEE